jgi:hypothetical protein
MDEHAAFAYEYELRAHDSIIATGRLTLEQQPKPGETITLGHALVTVREILPGTGTAGRLILERYS